jgi:hypothetical protein
METATVLKAGRLPRLLRLVVEQRDGRLPPVDRRGDPAVLVEGGADVAQDGGVQVPLPVSDGQHQVSELLVKCIV